MTMMRELWHGMKSVLRAARQIINAHLEPLGLTSAEGDILFHLLSAKGGLSQEALSDRLGVGKAAVSRTVGSLVRKGYLSRTRSRDDARANRVETTARAAQIAPTVEAAYEAVYAIVGREIERDELRRIATLLERVTAILEREGGA